MTSKANVVAVGAYLRKLREVRGLSVTKVAGQLDTSEAQIRKIERGGVDTRGSMLLTFCDLVDGSLDDIAQLMLSETATPEYAERVAERWVSRRNQGGKRAAEGRAEYYVNGENVSVN